MPDGLGGILLALCAVPLLALLVAAWHVGKTLGEEFGEFLRSAMARRLFDWRNRKRGRGA